MTGTTTGTITGTHATRYLYLTRHGEASPDETELTENGRRQAALLGDRLREVPLHAMHHGPLPRATQTARLIGDRLAGVPLHVSEPAGDYVPYVPQHSELPPESADATLARLATFPAEERDNGPRLAGEALARFTGPVEGGEPRHELVVTHAFLVAWLVRAALDAPAWRWIGLSHANAALTVIRYAPGRPASLVQFNDMGHLPRSCGGRASRPSSASETARRAGPRPFPRTDGLTSAVHAVRGGGARSS